MLQNRYGDTDFPVRDRWSNVRPYRQAAMRRDPRRAAFRSLIWLVPGLALLLVLIGGTGMFGHDLQEPGSRPLVLTCLIGFIVLVALGLVVGAFFDRTAPRREQQRYWALSEAAPISGRQQQLLALDAQSDFAIGGWNSSLDYGPAWSRMPEPLQDRHAGGEKRSFFITMPLFETDALRAKLDTDQHIASAPDVDLFVADAFQDRSLSAQFHQVLHSAAGERMLARVSSLTGVDQWELRALDQPEDGLPPRLLWGADSQLVIAVVRMAHLADHIDAQAAWQLIEHASEPAAALFDSWGAYWSNVRIGLAFRADRLDVIQQFDRTLTGLRHSAWPATDSAFPRNPVPGWLPAFTGTPTSEAGSGA